jgi:hypothetical protein
MAANDRHDHGDCVRKPRPPPPRREARMQHVRRAIAMRTRPRTCRYDARFESGARAARPSFAAPDSRLPNVQAGLLSRSVRETASPVRASSRTEADFFPLHRLARAAALIDDSPKNLVVAMNSLSRPPACENALLRALTLDRPRRPGMTAIAGLTCEPRAPGITASINVRSRSASSHHVTEPSVS